MEGVDPAQSGTERATSPVVLSSQPSFRLGHLTVEASRRRLIHDDGREETLEPRIMQVLIALAQTRGSTLSRQDLSTRCWGGRLVSADALNRVISRLRALSGGIGKGSFSIDTMNRVGYRLVAADTPVQAPAAEPAGNTRRTLLIGGLALTGGVIATGIGAGLWRYRNAPRTAPVIAALPFEQHGSSLPSDLIGLALARDMLRCISRFGGIRIISDASSFPLATEKLSARAIGRRLAADLILSGAVTQESGILRGTIALTDTVTQEQVWQHVATAPTGEPQALGDKLAGALMERIVGLATIRPLALPPRRRSNPAAYLPMIEAEQAFLDCRRLHLLMQGTAAGQAGDRAYERAEAALAIDPQDVRALLVLWGLARNDWSPRLRANWPPARDRAAIALDYIRRALLADPNDPTALGALGDYYRRYEWRWGDAEALLRRAIDNDPGLVEARWSYATLLGTLNRTIEAVEHAREVHRLDPENATRRGYVLPRLQYAAGQRREALQGYDALLRVRPGDPFITRELYMTALGERNPTGLERLARKTSGRAASMLAARISAAALALHGQPGRFVAMLDREIAEIGDGRPTVAGRRDSDLLFLASLEYGWAGQVDRSLDLLARALDAKSLNWTAALPFGIRPFPRAVREHARFVALWESDPRLVELVRIRLDNLHDGLARVRGA